MALTVGGNAVKASGENSAVSVPAENLSPNETYKIGVSAYKEEPYFTESTETGSMEGEETGAAEGTEGSTAGSGGTNTQKALTAKYYSTEAESNSERLPQYTPLNMTLNVNGTKCIKDDETYVYHAYVGEDPGTLTVNCAADSITVTRMDMTTGGEIAANADGTGYPIPDFTGSLMLKIDGKQGMDVTSVFLLVSRDETPPMLTLADPIFFADQDTGEYAVTGTADAGSEIIYGKTSQSATQSVTAGSDGRFTVSGTLAKGKNTGILFLSAKDSAGNESTQQMAMITRQTRYAVTVNGSYADVSGAGSYAAGSIVTVRAGSRSGYTFNGWTSGSNVVFDDPNAAETTFTMPDGSVTVTANWSRDGGSSSSGRDDSDPSYAVGIPDKTENGSVSVSPKNASQGDRVTVTVKPDAGYELDSLKVFDKNGKELELTGTADGKFSSNAPCTRAQAVTFLFRASKASADGAPAFSDVAADAYYAEAVKWATDNGITNGTTSSTFSPGSGCTRAQIVTFLWRLYAEK